jgi:ribonuclease H / adenosylcobalamin/alpha-ribazole phosphatase
VTERRFVLEADGGSRGNPGQAAFGFVVRDAVTGEVLVEAGEAIGIATNNVAEYSGLVAGLRACRDLDPAARVHVRLDSKLVIEQMSGGWKIKHEGMRALALEARAVLPPAHVTYEWIPRESNKDADRLVNVALDAVARGGDGRIERRGDMLTTEAAGLVPVTPAVSLLPRPEGRPGLPGWHTVGDPTVLMWVRHGVTDSTIAKRFSGSGGADLPLSDLGIAQAQAAGAEINARGGADVIVTSPLLRTRQTAQHIAGQIDVNPSDIVVLDDLRECAFGEWDGLTFAEVAQQDAEALAAWLGDAEVAPPGGESFRDVHVRIERALAHLLSEYPEQRVVIVAHVTPVKCAFLHAIEGSLEALFRIELPPASLTTISWYPDGNVNVRGIAETTHLRGL